MEKGIKAFCLDNGASCVKRGAVIVAGVEERVIVSALELKTSLEDLGGDIDEGGGEVGNEARGEVGEARIHAQVDEVPLAVLVGAEEDYSSGEGAKESRRNSTVETSSETFLA